MIFTPVSILTLASHLVQTSSKGFLIVFAFFGLSSPGRNGNVSYGCVDVKFRAFWCACVRVTAVRLAATGRRETDDCFGGAVMTHNGGECVTACLL